MMEPVASLPILTHEGRCYFRWREAWRSEQHNEPQNCERTRSRRASVVAVRRSHDTPHLQQKVHRAFVLHLQWLDAAVVSNDLVR